MKYKETDSQYETVKYNWSQGTHPAVVTDGNGNELTSLITLDSRTGYVTRVGEHREIIAEFVQLPVNVEFLN